MTIEKHVYILNFRPFGANFSAFITQNTWRMDVFKLDCIAVAVGWYERY